ncbi:MAG: reverse transcriptase family protein, partial [Gammaproteobacteria bacterium]|nr:reverse transcriptase family protein [Gammaproteobacteria bacterium]
YFVGQQLTDYMEDNRLFTRHQFGFRKNHSTNYLMFDLFDEIYNSKSKSYKPGIIFLDIKKAFDTVNHNILIEKMKYYGIGGTVLNWFKSYLADRYQCTRLCGRLSSFLVVLSGVPQGSILGPILFSIYINDIIYACNLSIPYLFADDGALFFENCCRKSFINMKIELITIIKWLSVNKLSFNVDKTEFMIFDTLDQIDEIVIELQNTSFSIKECKVTKYLGLMVDNKLDFKDHIEYIKKKILKRIGAMFRSKGLLPTKYRKMFANALMLICYHSLII